MQEFVDLFFVLSIIASLLQAFVLLPVVICLLVRTDRNTRMLRVDNSFLRREFFSFRREVKRMGNGNQRLQSAVDELVAEEKAEHLRIDDFIAGLQTQLEGAATPDVVANVAEQLGVLRDDIKGYRQIALSVPAPAPETAPATEATPAATEIVNSGASPADAEG